MDTLADLIDTVRLELSPTLVRPEPLAGLRAAATRLAVDLTAFVGFEARLGDSDDAVDLAFNLSDSGLRRLAEAAPHPSWERMSRLAQLWGEQADPPFSNGGELWIELDLGPETDFPAPNVFLAPSPGNRDGASLMRQARWILQEAVPAFLGRPVSPAVEGHALEAMEAVGGNLSKFQIGLMGARPVDGLRLCLFGLSTASLADVLSAASWPGDIAEPLSVARRYGPLVDHLGLHLDIGPTLFPSFGLECLFDKSPFDYQPTDEPRWMDLLDCLVDDGRATADERDALLRWPGVSVDQSLVFAAALETLKSRPVAGADDADRTTAGRVTRGLAYVKLGRDLRGKAVTKAYFGAYHDGRHAGGRHAGGRHAGGRHAGGRHAGGRHAGGRHAPEGTSP